MEQINPIKVKTLEFLFDNNNHLNDIAIALEINSFLQEQHLELEDVQITSVIIPPI